MEEFRRTFRYSGYTCVRCQTGHAGVANIERVQVHVQRVALLQLHVQNFKPTLQQQTRDVKATHGLRTNKLEIQQLHMRRQGHRLRDVYNAHTVGLDTNLKLVRN